MMRKFILFILVAAMVLVWFLPESFLSPLIYFLALGIVPVVNYQLGIILPVGAIVISVAALVVWVRQFSDDYLDYKTQDSKINTVRLASDKQSDETLSDQPVIDADELDLLSI